MLHHALFHDASREIVDGFLADTVARLGWWGAQAWWAEPVGLVGGPWVIGSQAPGLLADYLAESSEGSVVEDSGARYLRPTRLPVDEVTWLAPALETLIQRGLKEVVVYDVPGMFDLDVRLVFAPPTGSIFTQGIIDSLESSARLMPTVIRQEKERRDLSHGATHDPLTGVLNRRGLEYELENKPSTTALRALIFLDLDEYKAVNDTHGHFVGDEVLVDVAAQLAGQIRPNDSLARIGGDEFVLIANPVSGADGALLVAQRLLAAVSRDIISTTGATVSIAASVGVALWHPDETMAQALRTADGLMYEAKRFGGGIASEDGSGRIIITDAFSDTHEMTDPRSNELTVAAEVISSREGGALWGHLVSLSGAFSSLSAASVVAMIREAIEAPTVGDFGPGRLIVEVSGLGWSRGQQLSSLVEELLAVVPIDRLDLALGGDSAEDSMRLALAEVRARFGVAVVLTCTPSSSNPLSLVESENPRALLLASELVASLDASRPRTTLVRMVAAIADVLGVPIIARGAESPAVIAALGALGCQLITTRLPARHITEVH